MKREKLILITCIIIFGLCILLLFFSQNKEGDNAKENVAENTEQLKIEQEFTNESMNFEEELFQESRFEYDSIEFSYDNSQLNVEKILMDNEQISYFQLTLYEYLYERGYKEISEIKICEGKQLVDNIRFIALVKQNDETENKVIVEYDTELLSFFYYFEDTILGAEPVEILDLDEKLRAFIGEKIEELEKELGKYIFEQKIDAKKADVKWYYEEDNKLVIQLELQDEYLTFCKIIMDLETKEYQFLKWG